MKGIGSVERLTSMEGLWGGGVIDRADGGGSGSGRPKGCGGVGVEGQTVLVVNAINLHQCPASLRKARQGTAGQGKAGE